MTDSGRSSASPFSPRTVDDPQLPDTVIPMDTAPTVLLAAVVGVLVITLLVFLLPGALRRLRYRRADRRRELTLARAEENPPTLPALSPVVPDPVAALLSDSPPQGEPLVVEDEVHAPDRIDATDAESENPSLWGSDSEPEAPVSDAEWVVDPTLPTPPVDNPNPTDEDVSRVVEALSLGLSEDVTLEPAGPVAVQATWAGLDLVNAVVQHSDITSDLRQEWIVVAADGFEAGRVDVTWVWADDAAEWKILRLPALAA